MNKFDVFPKKIALFGLILLASVFVLLMNSISKNNSLIKSFYSHDVPGLQLYCGASRLISINQILQENKSPNLSSMKLNQRGILYSLDELIKIGSESNEKTPGLSTIDSVKNFRMITEKNDSIASSQELELLQTDMQDFIEDFLNRKNKMLEKQTELSGYIALVGFCGIMLFFGLIFYVYYLYKKNIEALTELTAHIEEQRLFSVQASKLASLGEMASGMAHEINNPLAVIGSTAKYIRKTLDKDPINVAVLKESLNDIDSTVLRISKIITGLRNISRDSSNEPMEPVLIKNIFDDVLGICSEKFKNNNVKFKIEDPQHCMDKQLTCQRVQISQVILNLLVNSFDAIKENAEKLISVELSQVDQMLQFKISDSGNGIPKEIREKLFQPFFTTKEIGQGTGLGLSISKTIIESHRGKLYLEPHSVKTCFIIEIPMGKV